MPFGRKGKHNDLKCTIDCKTYWSQERNKIWEKVNHSSEETNTLGVVLPTALIRIIPTVWYGWVKSVTEAGRVSPPVQGHKANKEPSESEPMFACLQGTQPLQGWGLGSCFSQPRSVLTLLPSILPLSPSELWRFLGGESNSLGLGPGR